MNKKVVLIFLAVLAFFAGQIFLECSLEAAGAPEKTFAEFLVPVFELVAGGFLGYFFKKNEDVEVIKNYEMQYTDTKAEMVHMENEIINLKKAATPAKTSAKKSASKVS